MAILKCKMCGEDLTVQDGMTVAECEYCGSKQTLPKHDDNRRANLYDRANHFRRNNEYDKAERIYEQILNEDTTDAEAYWAIVLCRYGIEYVEDPATHKRVPTVNRAQYTSIFDDDNYKSAIEHADTNQRTVYENEAKAINEIQKGILAISQKEEPFDVFICYKETDNSGRRTRDSVLANDLYHQLTQEGFKVFFSRITLEDKLGTAYEPYIFAALNSAKVMVVLGTKPEYFNAVWVKNEWSRYLALVNQSGGKKVLIPAYRDMDPYDLPEEFSHLQAQDMSKLGFMQDLIRGIKKKTGSDQPKAHPQVVSTITGTSDVAPLLKRVFMFLEDGEWDKAKEYAERVLDKNPENAEAYLGKLMADLKVHRREELKDQAQSFDNNRNYNKAMRFADTALESELNGYITHINTRNAEEKRKQEEERKDAVLDKANEEIEKDTLEGYSSAKTYLNSIAGWKDADKLLAACEKRIKELSDKKAKESIIAAQKKKKRVIAIGSIAAAVLASIVAFVIVLNTVIIPNNLIKEAKTLEENGQYPEAANKYMKAGLTEETKQLYWGSSRLTQISAGSFHTVGLKADGTVVATKYTGSFYSGQCDVASWKDIVAVSAGMNHTVGLKADGTVVAVGDNDDGQCNVQGWTDIVAVSAGDYHTVGLKADGTVVAVGNNYDVASWTDIVAISAKGYQTVGLKADGTVMAVGQNDCGQCDVQNWKDIVAVSAGDYHTVGLKADGTVVATKYTGSFYDGQCDVENWTDIVAVSADGDQTVGLKADGTVVAVGNNHSGPCNVQNWKEIVAVSAGCSYTVGLKADGTLVATGSDDSGKCNISDWKLW